MDVYDNKWKYLKKGISQGYELTTDTNASKSRANIVQLAFDSDDTRLVAVDSKGSAYFIVLSQECPQYYNLGVIGFCTFVAFNPLHKCEIFVGLTSTNIKILRLDRNVIKSYVLSGHNYAPTSISFYKYCALTYSHKEILIWNLVSWCQMHRLKPTSKQLTLKKALFSNMGLIAAMYQDGAIHTWMFNGFIADTKLHTKELGFNNVRDFIFTTDARAMIIAGLSNKILVLNTFNWNLIKSIDIENNFVGARQLAVVPQPLDGGANKIVAVLSTNSVLHFLDINSACLIKTSSSQPIAGVHKIAVSLGGRYVSYINADGSLIVIHTERLLSSKPTCTRKTAALSTLCSHSSDDHLLYIKQSIKQELNLQRLIPILKEFGQYSQNHRAIIWSTILKLPGNRDAFSTIANKIVWSKTTYELLKDYKLVDRTKISLLTMTIDCLIHWCPMLVHSTFLPRLIYPFTTVFQTDPLLSFEISLYLFLNYCQKWFEYHPLPPLNVLGIAENVLLEADPHLLKIFCERGVTSTDYVWPLLQTAMSEVLSGDEWLILWDHLWSYRKPSLLLMCVVAYSICTREIIISQLHSPKDFQQFYSSQSHVKVKALLEIALRLDRDIPIRIHPDRYLRDKISFLPSEGPYPPFLSEEYPRFLTDESRLTRLMKLKECERILRKHRRYAIRLSEEKRVSSEVQNFVKQIHETRINELRKYYDEQIRNKERQLESVWKEVRKEGLVKSTYDEVLSSRSMSDDDSDDGSGITVIANKNWNSKDCKSLQNQVEQLETEVQTLLSMKNTVQAD